MTSLFHSNWKYENYLESVKNLFVFSWVCFLVPSDPLAWTFRARRSAVTQRRCTLFAIMVLIYLFVNILHVASRLPSLAQQSQHNRIRLTLRASENKICTLLTLLTFTPRGRCAPPCWNVRVGKLKTVPLALSRCQSRSHWEARP